MEYLIARIQSDPTVEKVYFDEKGTWTLQPDNLHPIEKTAAEVVEEFGNLAEIKETKGRKSKK